MNTKSKEITQTKHQELEPSLLLAIMALCLGISDWIGLQIIGTSAIFLLISPQLYGMGLGIVMGAGLFIAFFRKKMNRDDLLLIARAIYRILLLFLLFTTILSIVYDFPPETLLFVLGTGLGVIGGMLTLSASLWLYLNEVNPSSR